MKDSVLRNKFIIIMGVFFTSFSAILVRAATAPSMVLVFYRMILAAVIMTFPGIRSLRKERDTIRPQDLICCLVSGFFLALHFTCYFEAVRRTSIAASLVLVDTEVFFVAFIMLFFFRESLSKIGWIGIVITFIGSVIIAVGDAGSGSGSLVGDLFAIGGAVSVSIYTVMGRLCRRRMTTSSYTTLVYWVASVTTLILLAVQGVPVSGYGWSNVVIGFGMTILCTLLGHSVYSWGLKYLPAAFISQAKLLEPVFSSILAFFIFAEVPALSALIGGIILISGLYLTSRE